MPSARDAPTSRSRDRSRDRDRDRDRERRDKDRGRDRSTSPTHKSRDREMEKDRERGKDFDKRSKQRKEKEKEHGRDRDRDRDRDRHQERDRSISSDEDTLDLAELGVKEISDEDYFLKSGEFKLWLKEDRGRYLDEMSSESAHKYFRKFVRRWNDGALKAHQYRAPVAGPASEQTGYKWSFASNTAGGPSLASIRQDVARSTHSSVPGRSGAGPTPSTVTSYGVGTGVGPSLPSSSRSGPSLGPSLPTAADRQYGHEAAQEARKVDRKSKHKEMYERANDYVPKSGGKEGKMEERRATNAENKKFRDKDVTAGLEVDDGTLMGDAGGFTAALRARDAASARRKDAKEVNVQDRRAADNDRLSERRAKESATMDMFKAMARERFG